MTNSFPSYCLTTLGPKKPSQVMHRVEEVLRLADALGIARVPELVAPRAAKPPGLPDGDYAVIHAAPMFRYKQWTKSGWRELVSMLAGRGLAVVATGGPGESERHYLDDIWNGAPTPVLWLDGALDWPQLAGLLAKARVYIGPDTSVTHLAAASGCPTVALNGPTDPRLWETLAGGRPRRDVGRGRHVAAPAQCLAGAEPAALHAVPAWGCERRLEGYSACLDELPAAVVTAAVEQALES